MLESQVKTIARTETSKTSVDIIEFKSKKCNVPCYIWRASGGGKGDGRTRKSHRGMADVIVFWNDPPAPEDLFPIYGENGKKYKNTLGNYHVGCCPNCRCVPSPVIFKGDLKFSVRVYTNGKIVSMNKGEFDSLYNSKTQQMKEEQKREKEKIEQKKEKEEPLVKHQKAQEKTNDLENKIENINSRIKSIKLEIEIESRKDLPDNNLLESKEKELQKLFNDIQNIKSKLRQIQNSLTIDRAVILVKNFVIDNDLENISQKINNDLNKCQNLEEEIKETINKIPRSRRVKLPNGKITKLTEGTHLTNIEIISGKGCKNGNTIKKIDSLINDYPDIKAKPKDWSKRKGTGFVDFKGRSRKAEIHWFEALQNRVELKVKMRNHGFWFLD